VDRPRLCILGSINADLVVRSPRLPSRGETLLGGPFQRHPGGKGANQAVAAARMGAEVSFIGAVGDDEHGRLMRATLDAEGIDTSRISTRTAPTGVALITVADSGDNTIVVAPGANAEMTPADIDTARDAIAAADLLVMQLETPLAAVLHAARLARDLGTTVLLNAAPAQRLPAELLTAADVLIVNETEAALLTGAPLTPVSPGGTPSEPSESGVPSSPDLDALLARLALLGPTTSVLTAGPRGAVFAHANERGHLAAMPVNSIDTVGAGDAFCGAFAARLAEQQINAGRASRDRMAVMDAVCWGCAAGALATTKHGAIPSLPTRAEVVALLRARG
jgi:ribokinase